MRIAVCVPNIGNIDPVWPLCKQSVVYDLMYWSENTLPFPLPNLDDRMRGKYLKTQSHKFLNYDVIIHLDSSIEVINEHFISYCITQLTNKDIVMELHQQRKGVYEEIEHIIEEIRAGNRYLIKRYVKQPLFQEHDFYRQEGLPKNYPLYQCSFFARWNNKNVNEMFNDAWDKIIRFSNFDQSQICYALWKHNMAVNAIDTSDLFIRNRHLNYNK